MTLHLIDSNNRQRFMCGERADERFAAITSGSRHTCYYCQLANENRITRMIAEYHDSLGAGVDNAKGI